MKPLDVSCRNPKARGGSLGTRNHMPFLLTSCRPTRKASISTWKPFESFRRPRPFFFFFGTTHLHAFKQATPTPIIQPLQQLQYNNDNHNHGENRPHRRNRLHRLRNPATMPDQPLNPPHLLPNPPPSPRRVQHAPKSHPSATRQLRRPARPPLRTLSRVGSRRLHLGSGIARERPRFLGRSSEDGDIVPRASGGEVRSDLRAGVHGDAVGDFHLSFPVYFYEFLGRRGEPVQESLGMG